MFYRDIRNNQKVWLEISVLSLSLVFLFSLCSESERGKKSEKSRDFTASFMALLCSIIILLSLKALKPFILS